MARAQIFSDENLTFLCWKASEDSQEQCTCLKGSFAILFAQYDYTDNDDDIDGYDDNDDNVDDAGDDDTNNKGRDESDEGRCQLPPVEHSSKAEQKSQIMIICLRALWARSK